MKSRAMDEITRSTLTLILIKPQAQDFFASSGRHDGGSMTINYAARRNCLFFFLFVFPSCATKRRRDPA